jgi:hypothetical protein
LRTAPPVGRAAGGILKIILAPFFSNENVWTVTLYSPPVEGKPRVAPRTELIKLRHRDAAPETARQTPHGPAAPNWRRIGWVRHLARRLALGLCLAAPAQPLQALTGDEPRPRIQPAAAGDFAEYIEFTRTHTIGDMAFSLTNWGLYGNGRRVGCCDYCTAEPAKSWEYPMGSGLDYLGTGGLWIGAIRGEDTLVSLSTDGVDAFPELFPRPAPDGNFLERTTRPVLKAGTSKRCVDVLFSEDAVSEQDLITYYYDTVTSPAYVYPDRFDGRVHKPIGLEIEQKSYAWSYDYAKDFIIMDLGLHNVSGDVINKVYLGIFMDFDVGHYRLTWSPNWDDMSGFIGAVPSALAPNVLDTLNIAWSADNDGDPGLGRFESISVTGVGGVRVLRSPSPSLKFSFNWWASNNVASRDWGPNKKDRRITYRKGSLGTPQGDVNRYLMMCNGELDYDQIESAIDHQADGWLPPPRDAQLAGDLADGYDTRFLFSFGPFDIPEDSTLSLALAFVSGANFHADARNFRRYFDPSQPDLFRQHLDFSDFIRNAQWAGWVYDTPGYDTDGDGYRGEYRMVGGDTLYYRGDGIPDFKGPPPPTAPELRFRTGEGKVIMRWNGFRSETSLDYFSGTADFEGYRVYMSRTGRLEDYALLAQRDNVNYLRLKYQPSYNRWEVSGRPFKLDSLRTLYNDLVDTVYNFRPFHPDSFSVRLVERAMREVVLDAVDRSRLDTNYYCFEPFNANEQVNDTTMATLADCCASQVMGVIRKRYPFAAVTDTVIEDGVAYPAYYEYEYALEGVHVAEPVFLSVTAFDFGDPEVGLSSLESSPVANAVEVWPINSTAVVDSLRPKPGVYPNPYRLADDYNGNNWENARGQEPDPERARKVTFTNVPDTCTISIYSLDGDLVRKLEHKANPLSSEASVVVWNMITRNTQAIKTGIYIYAIESKYGTDVGKLVVIK